MKQEVWLCVNLLKEGSLTLAVEGEMKSQSSQHLNVAPQTNKKPPTGQTLCHTSPSAPSRLSKHLLWAVAKGTFLMSEALLQFHCRKLWNFFFQSYNFVPCGDKVQNLR